MKNASGSLTTYTYDVANQLETSRDATGVTTYTFDANGNQQGGPCPERPHHLYMGLTKTRTSSSSFPPESA